ncbi:hypothetical protein [Bradyrhizobium sp. SZCCHNS3053]|uniref:hypothetical protein n=1 Tax=Bradyrhizobium sp. SZCCHNS3053 TaxID=3057322 RepID=UPI0029169F4A|nr:hypothetical protein [Bradyrhizobium sp. SZCCHNS3053]
MPHELLSGILGSLAAEVASKIAPARQGGESAEVPAETLQRRNRRLYRCLLASGCLGFAAPLLALAIGSEDAPWRNAWLTGVIFGLPFLIMLIFLALVWATRGSKRATELLFYFERQQRTHIYVFYLYAVPLAVLGLTSSVLVWL